MSLVPVNYQHEDALFKTSNVALFIDRRLIQEIQTPEKKTHFVARRALQATSFVVGFGSQIPFVGVNLALGGDNKVYGGILAYGNCASFGSLVSYSLLGIVNSQMKPLSCEERSLKESRIGPTLKKVFFISSTTLGFASQIPFAYTTYLHNKPSKFNPDGLLLPCVLFVSASWIYTYSAYMGLSVLRESQALTAYEKELSKVRKKMCDLVEENRQLLACVGEDVRQDFIGAYEKIQEMNSAPDRIEAVYTLFTRRIGDQTFDLPKSRCIDYIGNTFGCLCSFVNIGTLSYIAWRGTDALTDNTYANITITAIYAGTALYLYASAIPKTAVTVCHLFKDLITCSYQPTLSDQLTPKLAFSLKALSLATAALSYGLSVQMSKDSFGFCEELEIPMEILLSCASTFLVLMAMFSITDQILEYKVEKMGSKEQKAIIKIHKKMKEFSFVLKSSPLIEFARFLRVVPEEAVRSLTHQTEVCSANLKHYIETHIPKGEKERLLEDF